MRWFRFYTEAMNDPKILQLRPQLYRFWTFCLCIASEAEPRGTLPFPDEMALRMKMKRSDVERFSHELAVLELIHIMRHGLSLIDHCLTSDQSDVNQTLTRRYAVIHHWIIRQPPSDSSASRTKCWRERTSKPSRSDDVTVPVTVPVTGARRSVDTELDTEKENTQSPHTPPHPAPAKVCVRSGDDLAEVNQAIALLGADARTEHLGLELGRVHNTARLVGLAGWKWHRAARWLLEASIEESKRRNFAYLKSIVTNLTDADREEKPTAPAETKAQRRYREQSEGFRRMEAKEKAEREAAKAKAKGVGHAD